VEEREIKLRMADAGAARAAVARLGAVLETPRHFEDNVLFDDERGSLRGRGRVLRLRRTSTGIATITFKGEKTVEDGVRSRVERETEVADADTAEAVLGELGYRPRFRYQKFREAWVWRDVEIVVDETPIGTFLEIEGPIATIHAAAEALGRGRNEYVIDSYVALFLAAGGTGDMVFPEARRR
jgi:adenylate cyclase class 2